MKAEKENSTTGSDPLIDEVRRIRAALSAEFGNDVRRLAAHLQDLERKYGERVLRMPDARKRASPDEGVPATIAP